ncbi:hypothetical protein BMS3Bbin14_01066 [bacterium BMS3Bbin14]|nr:hypothetical protein BMS3Abin13_01880 [bacterium BMS3Abin13]GBE52592.1 hypothetical protein BMS3Bbin14_01066 [bacterium BMS3Bbin14]HDL98190.1 DUF1003 domain-containing protein [Desulfobacteraceae bacterium]HDO31431.1 DUF1003 domain-containing protein [Desulfobacteraceae bacterium]
MNREKKETRTCQVCHQEKRKDELIPPNLVRESIQQFIKGEVRDWSDDGDICLSCLNTYRAKYVQRIMEKDLGELDSLEQEVVQSIHDNDILSENINEEYEERLCFGDRIADKVAAFGGSWSFILSFLMFMAIWIVGNSLMLIKQPFDPYPFILLNLMLSLVAALQAPVIMMSQNRQEKRDRLRAQNDYQVNLKAELEIRIILEKLDTLIHYQWLRFLETQQIQMDMLEEISSKSRRR